MEALTKIFIAMLNLLEAEGRAMQRGMVRLWMLLLMTLAACVLALGGTIALCYGVYWLLISVFGPIAAAVIIGVTLLVIAGGIAWAVYMMVRLNDPKPQEEAREQTSPARREAAEPTEPELHGRVAPIPS